MNCKACGNAISPERISVGYTEYCSSECWKKEVISRKRKAKDDLEKKVKKEIRERLIASGRVTEPKTEREELALRILVKGLAKERLAKRGEMI